MTKLNMFRIKQIQMYRENHYIYSRYAIYIALIAYIEVDIQLYNSIYTYMTVCVSGKERKGKKQGKRCFAW